MHNIFKKLNISCIFYFYSNNRQTACDVNNNFVISDFILIDSAFMQKAV